MRKIILSLAAIYFILVHSIASAANTWGTDISDLWWNPNESGWGANVAHQGDILFMTLYVYGDDHQPKWYFASGMASQGGSNRFVFVGDLYETSGPYFGSGFDPNALNIRKVGTAKFDLTTINHAIFDYSVDGVNVKKSIERQTFRNNNLSGKYLGATKSTFSGCPSGNGAAQNTASFTINHDINNKVSILASINSGINCTYSGNYSQAGRMGYFTGTASCTNGASFNFQAYEIEASYQGFFMRYDANYGGTCQEHGVIASLKT